MKRSRAGSGVAVALAATMTVVLAGCAGPEFTYVRDSSGQAYFKVPAQWQKVDQKALDRVILGDPDSPQTQQLKSLIWTVAYDAHSTPSIEHLVGSSGPTNDPFALAMVRPLTEEQRQQASLNFLRNALFPVVGEQATASGVEIIKDEELPQRGGAKGVRTVFNVTMGEKGTQTFNQTAYLSGDGSRMSVLLIQCSSACYKAQSKQIDLIAQSFKIKPDTP
ncbi:hypothetical protein AB0K60_02715 [Thermopolyspora sp. NPDC052614]|uniref:hypothetical protein n=1 Tax=Thermopolyspora sp. NPDC052614 TaxID=3155682 RepID=UPI0034391086